MASEQGYHIHKTYIMYRVSCIMYHVSFTREHASCIMYRVSCTMYQVVKVVKVCKGCFPHQSLDTVARRLDFVFFIVNE